eukprot:197887-Chlamydomonas_euryale.AAC.7
MGTGMQPKRATSTCVVWQRQRGRVLRYAQRWLRRDWHWDAAKATHSNDHTDTFTHPRTVCESRPSSFHLSLPLHLVFTNPCCPPVRVSHACTIISLSATLLIHCPTSSPQPMCGHPWCNRHARAATHPHLALAVPAAGRGQAELGARHVLDVCLAAHRRVSVTDDRCGRGSMAATHWLRCARMCMCWPARGVEAQSRGRKWPNAPHGQQYRMRFSPMQSLRCQSTQRVPQLRNPHRSPHLHPTPRIPTPPAPAPAGTSRGYVRNIRNRILIWCVPCGSECVRASREGARWGGAADACLRDSVEVEQPTHAFDSSVDVLFQPSAQEMWSAAKQ